MEDYDWFDLMVEDRMTSAHDELMVVSDPFDDDIDDDDVEDEDDNEHQEDDE